MQPPYVPGVGVAGLVSSVGDGVDNSWIGRRILADIEGGGYAERVVAPVEGLIPIPEALGSREAMALLHDGRIKPIIGQTYPLERVAEAHAAIEARSVIGKTLLLI